MSQAALLQPKVFAREQLLGGRSEQFDQLIEELKALSGRSLPLEVEERLRLAGKQVEIERALIVLLQSDTYSGPEARQTVRVPAGIEGTLRTSTARHPVWVADVGCGGARVELQHPIDVRAEVELEVRLAPGANAEFISRFGHVAWVRGSSTGIEFDRGSEPEDQRMLQWVLELLRRQR